MSKKPPPESALFVRLPAAAGAKLDRAAEALGMRKKDIVAGLVARYVDPDSHRGLNALGTLANKVAVDIPENGLRGGSKVGSYSFQPYDPPEVLNADQAGQFLQIDPGVVTQLAEAGKLPGRKLGNDWRFSRAALVAWLSGPEAR